MMGLEAYACGELAVPRDVMAYVVQVESSFNPWAIGVVGGRLVRQPRSLPEAVSTAHALEREGRDFSVGLAQVNVRNFAQAGFHDYASAFEPCANLVAGARILADCHVRAGGDWPRAFSCYYSGNFSRGFRDGYVARVLAAMGDLAVPLAGDGAGRWTSPATGAGRAPLDLVQRRGSPRRGHATGEAAGGAVAGTGAGTGTGGGAPASDALALAAGPAVEAHTQPFRPTPLGQPVVAGTATTAPPRQAMAMDDAFVF
jgi:type IV secretion system protein VirB1